VWAESQKRRLFNVAKRTGQWDTYKETINCYNKEIRKDKRSSWRRYCHEINDVPGSSRLMRIMAKQTTNRVSTIKLHDGQYILNWKREIFRVHFLDFKLIEDSDD
jgi:hypothetical protein